MAGACLPERAGNICPCIIILTILLSTSAGKRLYAVCRISVYALIINELNIKFIVNIRKERNKNGREIV
jgi:hypothetical protein